MSKMKIFPEFTEQEEELFKQEARQLCLNDLHYLAKEILGYNRLTDHYHKRMCQDIDTPKYRFRLLLHPRGHFKSTIGTESRSCQKLIRNPNERILISNAKLENSRKFLRAIAYHFNYNSKFRWLWREWWMENYATEYHRAEFGKKLDWVIRDTQDEFTLLRPYEGREASITTGAVDASMVSQHYSTIICDDLINREYVRTQEMVEKSILYFKDVIDLLDPDGELEVIGTRWSHMDLYHWIIEEFGGVASLRVPDGYLPDDVVERSQLTPEEEKEWMISIQPVYTNEGRPVFPEEFTPQVLRQLEDSKGPYEFGAQYLLNPTPAEHQKFKEEWFKPLDVMPDVSSLDVCMTVDPAKSLEDQADKFAIAICGYDDYNRMYFIDGLNERLDVEQGFEAVWEYAVHYYKEAKFFLPMGFEAVGFQETYLHAFQRRMMETGIFIPIYEQTTNRPGITRRQQSKEERILRLVPRIKFEFYVPRRMPKSPYNKEQQQYDLVMDLKWQLLNFPFAGHDDLADALADQLEIAQAHRLPTEQAAPPAEPKREFTHHSVVEDRARKPVSRLGKYNDAVR